MQIEFVISTMNRTEFSFIEKMFKNLGTKSYSILVINQCSNVNKVDVQKIEYENARVISVSETGLSKSRNLGLKNATGEICVFTDDDVIFETNILEIIENCFSKKIDVCTFKAYFQNGVPMKPYKEKSFKHNLKTIMRISSIEGAFRLKFLKKNNLKFDNLFGLGAQFPACEENIFFKDLLKANAQIYYFPEIIVSHPFETTGGILNAKGVYTRGAAFFRMYGMIGVLIAIVFVLNKRKKIQTFNITVWKSINLIWRGFRDYKNVLNSEK